MKKIFLLVFSLLLCACGPATQPGRSFAPPDHTPPVSKPYTIKGKTYVPYSSAHGYTETGIASWYGPGFHGKMTSCGEKYDQNALTAAHKLLPFHTNLKVTNLKNGRSVIVRITDRGPFSGERVLDLSHRAAKELGMVEAGTARVRIEAINTNGPVLTPDEDLEGDFYVQLGAFGSDSNVRRLLADIRQDGFPCRALPSGKKGLTFIQVGPFSSYKRTEDAATRYRSRFPDLFVIRQ